MSAKAVCVNWSEMNYCEEKRSDELCISRFVLQGHKNIQYGWATNLNPMNDVDMMSYTEDIRVEYELYIVMCL